VLSTDFSMSRIFSPHSFFFSLISTDFPQVFTFLLLFTVVPWDLYQRGSTEQQVSCACFARHCLQEGGSYAQG